MTQDEVLVCLREELLKVEQQIKDLAIKKSKILELISECESSLKATYLLSSQEIPLTYFYSYPDPANKEIILTKADGLLREDRPGWLKYNVVDLARHIFDNVDSGVFELRRPEDQTETIQFSQNMTEALIQDFAAESNLAGLEPVERDSQFFLGNLQSKVSMEKENKPFSSILGFTKPILKVLRI